MKRFARWAALIGLAVMLGCEQPEHEVKLDGAEDAWMVTTLQDAAVARGIITQHTLFPYHFVDNSSSLNDLGQSDFNVLAAHFAKHPGELGIRRGHVSDTLYRERTENVKALLAKGGVATERMIIADDVPGGDGLTSERVLKIMENLEGESSEESTEQSSTTSKRKNSNSKSSGTGGSQS
jgi:hypothetical protein